MERIPSPVLPGQYMRVQDRDTFGKKQYFDIRSGVKGSTIWMEEEEANTSSDGPFHRSTFPVNVKAHDEAAEAARRHRDPSPSPCLTQLIFRVYFSETVRGSDVETDRTRLMLLVFRLDDETVELLEPHEDNSGLDQGVFLARTRLTKPESGRPYSPADFLPGVPVNLVGHVFHVYGASEETGEYMKAQYGVEYDGEAPPPSTYHHPSPVSGHNWSRPTKVYADAGFEPHSKLGFFRRRPDTKARFLKYSGSVLRFECVWDDTHRPFGDRRVLQLMYYLEDDTVEIVELLDRNSGRDEDFRRLFARQQLPLTPPSSDPATRVVGVGGASSSSLSSSRRPSTAPAVGSTSGARLGFFDGVGQDEAAVAAEAEHVDPPPSRHHSHVSPITGHPLYDPSAAAAAKRPSTSSGGGKYVDGRPYTPLNPPTKLKLCEPAHIRCGHRLPVAGKWLLVRRCDRFTRDWYRKELGIDQEFPEAPLPPLSKSSRPTPSPLLPVPHDGVAAVGTEADSRANTVGLTPKPAKPDFEQFYSMDGKQLRFSARFVSQGPMSSSTSAGVSGLFSADALTPLNNDRRFIVTFYLSDDTVSVYETAEPNSGFTSGKFLDRGRHRKAHTLPLTATSGAAPGSKQYALAAQRRFKQGHRFGYEYGYGQGYPGGLVARSGRVDAGAVGVGAGVGAVEAAGNRLADPARPFTPADFFVGAPVEFAHAPGQVFVLTGADRFTRNWLAEHGVDAAGCGVGLDDSLALDEGTTAPLLPGCDDFVRQPAMLNVAGRVYGCIQSVADQARRLDRDGAGTIPSDSLRLLLARVGAAPPAVDIADINAVLDHYSDDAGMVNIAAFVLGLRGASNVAAGLPDRLSRVQQQLRSALLASVPHMRKVFRDLDLSRRGIITPDEFKFMLRRHTLDAGLTSADVAALMSQFPPPAPLPAGDDRPVPTGSISWRGFLDAIVGAQYLTPAELQSVVDLVIGVGVELHGAGTAPACPDYSRRPSPVLGRTIPAPSPVTERPMSAFASTTRSRLTGTSTSFDRPDMARMRAARPATASTTTTGSIGTEAESKEGPPPSRSGLRVDGTRAPPDLLLESSSELLPYEAGASSVTAVREPEWAAARKAAGGNWQRSDFGAVGTQSGGFASDSYLGRNRTMAAAAADAAAAAPPTPPPEVVTSASRLREETDLMRRCQAIDTAGAGAGAGAGASVDEDSEAGEVPVSPLPLRRREKEDDVVFGNSPRFGGRHHYTLQTFGKDGLDVKGGDETNGTYPGPYTQPPLPDSTPKGRLVVQGRHVSRPPAGSPEKPTVKFNDDEAPKTEEEEGESSSEDVGSLVDRMVEFFRDNKYRLTRTFSLFDTHRHGRLDDSSFIAALHSAGFDMSRRDQDLIKARLFPANEGVQTLDYTLFLDTLKDRM